ncbi:hypothetical protein E2C01_082578 [Portunus trituberculatus]|uniref:Uncharacterized protein n=1 Tax=Portunus trituberculatus TaxID=210409 RepID=A0A5B7J229_PORTR|nr:hypothetical protein [Portunus trituberculatus]
MILCLSLPLLFPLTISCLQSKFFVMMFSMPSLALTLGRLMDLMGSLLLFSKTVLPYLYLAWLNSFNYDYFYLSFLLEVCYSVSLFLKSVTVLITQTTVL